MNDGNRQPEPRGSRFHSSKRGCALALCLAFPLGAQAKTGAQEVPPNWIENPTGEAAQRNARRSLRGKKTWDLPGWTSEGPEWVAAESGWSKVPSHSGETYLTCGRSEGGRVHQDIPLSRLPKGSSHIAFLAWARSHSGRDEHAIAMTFLGAKDKLLAQHASPGAKSAEWHLLSLFRAIPRGAKSVRIELIARKHSGKWCDAFFDDLLLVPCGSETSKVFAKSSAKSLAARLKSAKGAERLRLELGMAFAGGRSFRTLEAELGKARGSERARLFALLVAPGHKEAAKLLRKTLRSKSAEDADLQLAGLEHVEILRAWPSACAALLTSKKKDLRERALERLTRKPDRACILELAKFSKTRKPANALLVLEKLRAARAPAELCFAKLLEPHLKANADSDVRSVAMLLMGEQRDERFREHLPKLYPVEKDRAKLGRWIQALAHFDDVPAIEMALGFVEKGFDSAPGAFVEMLPRMTSKPCLDWCAKTGLLHETATVRLAAARALRTRASDYEAELARHLDDADEEVAIAAAQSLATSASKTAQTKLEKIAAADRMQVSAAALRALASKSPKRASAIASKIVTEARAWTSRAAALEVLSQHDVDAAREALRACTEDADGRVRIAAYLAHASIRERASVEKLLAALDREGDHVDAFILDALYELTGVSNGDPASWKRWWKLAGKTFEVPAKAPEKGLDVKLRQNAGTAASYYGIPLIGKAFVFVIDLSGSMREKNKSRTRLDAAKDELVRVLGALPRDATFNIVAFSTSPRAYERQLVPARAKQIESAKKWVRALVAKGATNIFDSVDLALSMDGVESIFVLTDGGPSTGLYTDMDKIREVVRRKNRDRRIRIHTISTGGGKRARSFLEKLAEENWGRSQNKQ